MTELTKILGKSYEKLKKISRSLENRAPELDSEMTVESTAVTFPAASTPLAGGSKMLL